ncbi:hypothetical protein [Campylobacter sp. RM16192]|uniref:hypothetical protein n=1 Tax=Campylobacter sp. RM16192 TaxID=1660080 RepID=UPI001F41AC81|nr:hypothetical protein [Campylobacter sp. RM16192]
MISTEIDIESARKKSRIAGGKGTIIIASIATITATIAKPLNLIIGSKKGATSVKILRFCLANTTS